MSNGTRCRIRVLRAEKGWSQAELAERVQVSRNSINAVENGKFDPSLPLAFRIADAFELKIEDVFLRGIGHLHDPHATGAAVLAATLTAWAFRATAAEFPADPADWLIREVAPLVTTLSLSALPSRQPSGPVS